MPIKWLTLLFALLAGGPLHADTLQPFLPHHDRSPQDAWVELQKTDRAHLFVQSLATRHGKSTTEVIRILDSIQSSQVGVITDWFYSDGWFASSGGYQIGTISRAPHPNEQGFYLDGVLWFSARCGNAVKHEPEPSDVMVCTEGRETGAITTVTGGFATNGFISEPLVTHGSWEFTPLTCTSTSSGDE